MRKHRHGLTPYLVSVASVALVGLCAHALTLFLPLPHVSILFLAAVVISAALWGFWPGVFAALLSAATEAFFFYTPLFDFRVKDAQNLADLAAFVMVAAFTSRLASSVRARALEAQRRQRDMTELLAFSERLAAAQSDTELEQAIIGHLSAVLGHPVRLAPGEAHPYAEGWHWHRLATAQRTAGWIGAPAAAAAADSEYGKAILGQAALAIERARLRGEVAEARLRAQGDALREALLNFVSHDLKTPLAAIFGSATALESLGEHAAPQARRELTAAIRDEAERLTSYFDNLLDLTRIRSGRLAPRLELVELADILNAALRRKEKALQQHVLHVELPRDLPMLRLDLFLMEHALANVLDNAARYSPPGSALRISAAVAAGEVVLEVADAGSGIASEDLGRVFEAFYRGAAPAGTAASGSGLGLAICRAFVEANDGAVEAASAGPGQGTIVRLRFPLPERAALAEDVASDD